MITKKKQNNNNNNNNNNNINNNKSEKGLDSAFFLAGQRGQSRTGKIVPSFSFA